MLHKILVESNPLIFSLVSKLFSAGAICDKSKGVGIGYGRAKINAQKLCLDE